MADRITAANLAERVRNLNRRMEHHGSTARYTVGHRYDYYAIDRTDENGVILSGPIVAGTKRELADWLNAAMVVLDDVDIYRQQ
ncbi:MAG: hypothetical protein C5B48_08400 [Candidatus Rokuibacteriota bacterium]|nr:MAG: hypothetical protein C5B48_08400 [Candidatus Rokubacteria bacterium]